MLKSDWQVLATAGATVDGRKIKENWLTEIAESYDPEVYTANINGEHETWYGNLGHVLEVRLGKSKDGKVTLEGVVCPNYRLINMNMGDQKTFWSIEVEPKFADTGKAYLTGLAATDKPASLGTSKAKFSKNDNAVLGEFIAFSLDVDGAQNLEKSDVKPDLITSEEQTLLKKLFNLFNASNGKNDSDEEDEMKQEQLDQLTASITTAMTAGFSKLQENLEIKFSTEKGDGDGNGDGQEPPTVNAEDSKFSDRLDSIEKSVGSLVTGFEKLSKAGVGATNIEDDGDDTAPKVW